MRSGIGRSFPALTDYIRIPNKSPAFDPDWEEHGHMDKAVALFAAWAREKLKHLPGATLEVVRLPGRTPLIFIEVPGNAPGTILMYGHLDKQPEMTGWTEGPGPWEPVLKDDKLYGRGGADDGYAMFAGAVGAAGAERTEHRPCPRRDRDRGVRGIRFARPAFLYRSSGGPHRHTRSGGVPGFRLRQLRAALAHHLACAAW